MDFKDTIIENVYDFITKLKYSFKKPEIVMIIKPSAYYELLAEARENIKYINSNFIEQIDYLSIIGLRIPVIKDDTLPENVIYQLLSREDYERIEKEKLYKRFYTMFCEELNRK